jgi:lipoyl(octanoyl) transferase
MVPKDVFIHHFLGNEIEHGLAMDLMESHAVSVRSGDAHAQVLLSMEHAAVVTTGRETLPEHIAGLSDSVPIVPVNRGGQATYHGPGILVGYPVLNLRDRTDGLEPDLHHYLRALESALMSFVEHEFGLPCVRKPGFTGVWTHGFPGHGTDQPRKIAAIGVGCRRWVTTHGFALNLNPDLSLFRTFVPCGITDAETSSVEGECRRAFREFVMPPMKEVAIRVHEQICRALQAEGWLTGQPSGGEALQNDQAGPLN